ncbi:unnamed protein product [Caenorhabditis brenneri]
MTELELFGRPEVRICDLEDDVFEIVALKQPIVARLPPSSVPKAPKLPPFRNLYSWESEYWYDDDDRRDIAKPTMKSVVCLPASSVPDASELKFYSRRQAQRNNSFGLKDSHCDTISGENESEGLRRVRLPAVILSTTSENVANSTHASRPTLASILRVTPTHFDYESVNQETMEGDESTLANSNNASPLYQPTLGSILRDTPTHFDYDSVNLETMEGDESTLANSNNASPLYQPTLGSILRDTPTHFDYDSVNHETKEGEESTFANSTHAAPTNQRIWSERSSVHSIISPTDRHREKQREKDRSIPPSSYWWPTPASPTYGPYSIRVTPTFIVSSTQASPTYEPFLDSSHVTPTIRCSGLEMDKKEEAVDRISHARLRSPSSDQSDSGKNEFNREARHGNRKRQGSDSIRTSTENSRVDTFAHSSKVTYENHSEKSSSKRHRSRDDTSPIAKRQRKNDGKKVEKKASGSRYSNNYGDQYQNSLSTRNLQRDRKSRNNGRGFQKKDHQKGHRSYYNKRASDNHRNRASRSSMERSPKRSDRIRSRSRTNHYEKKNRKDPRSNRQDRVPRSPMRRTSNDSEHSNSRTNHYGRNELKDDRSHRYARQSSYWKN